MFETMNFAEMATLSPTKVEGREELNTGVDVVLSQL
jgi:hypothetical protein